MKILLIEDDQKVINFLKENLKRDNFSVSSITTIKELKVFLENQTIEPDLIILDRLLGNDDTKVYLKSIIQSFPETPILYLSALNSPQEKANLLDEGADDYLGKPFSLVELQARVRALLRRRKTTTADNQNSYYLKTGDIIIDLKSRIITCKDQKIDLTPKEFSLFVNFCENPNRVFSKYQLLDIIWETNLDVESNVIEVNVMNIRKKLENSQSSLKILSKRNVGYWLED